MKKERYLKLDIEEQQFLKMAIDNAVQKYFGRDYEYQGLTIKQRRKLAEEIIISEQTLEKYYEGATVLSCVPSYVELIIEYIEEGNWSIYVKKCKAKDATITEVQKENDPTTEVMTALPDETSPIFDNQHKWKIWKVFFCLIVLFFLIFIFSKKVTNTSIDANLLVNAVTFDLETVTVINKIETKDYFRIDSAIWYGASFLDGKKYKLVANAFENSNPVSMEQLRIPAGVRVTVESPIEGQLFVKLLAEHEEAYIEGNVTNFKSLTINKEHIIPADAIISYTGAVSFKVFLQQNEAFEFAMINKGSFEIQWMVVKNIHFLHKENFFDINASSSILNGVITFLETKESLQLQKFDDFDIILTKPLRMILSPENEGIRIQFSGDVNVVFLGSNMLGKSSKNIMPRVFTLLPLGFQVTFWVFTCAVSIFLVYSLIGRKK